MKEWLLQEVVIVIFLKTNNLIFHIPIYLLLIVLNQLSEFVFYVRELAAAEIYAL